MVYPEAYNRMMANAAGDAPRSVPAQMWDWFCDDAPAFCELQFRKALLFWDAREIPNNVSLDFDGIMASWILRILVIGRNFILFPLGIAGILFFIGELRRKKEPGLIMLYCFSAAFYAAVIVFYILSRFKAPFLPMLILFGGGAISAWWDIYRNSPPEKRVLKVGKIMVFLLIGFWMSNAAYDTYRVCEPAINRWIYPDGIVLDMNGENIHRIDYGPYPFGGWCYQDLKPGDRIVKEFAGMKNEKVQCLLMLQADDAVYVQLTANGIPYSFFMNAVKPPASGRRMLPLNASLSDGKVEIVIKSVSGGKLNGVYDNQRVYDRSMINGKVLDGEWIVRCISDRDI